MALKILLAQLNFVVGDIEGNCDIMLACINSAKREYKADCIVFSELALTGYPPEDLLFRNKINLRVKSAVDKLTHASRDITIIFGAPWEEESNLYNAAIVLQNGALKDRYFKIALPNYNVFDEKRYFTEGAEACVVNVLGVNIGITICEDAWTELPIRLAKQAGADIIVNINASPYHIGKQDQREETIFQRVKENTLPIFYLNQVGGQDELVFDGSSFVVNDQGNITVKAKSCEEDNLLIEYEPSQNSVSSILVPTQRLDGVKSEEIYRVLKFGLKDYIEKNHFKGGLIGLSGGIDSALALTLAVDAIGPGKVHAVMMPSKYTSKMSLDDAQTLAANLGVNYSVIEIDSLVSAFTSSLSPLFSGLEKDTTEENIQARIRGVLLMAISNKFGNMVISTGNKSEMAVGYATLYGDMAGGFAPLKDVPKMLVYELSRYRNTVSQDIPQRIIERPPSAELAPNQIDQDSLPPYEILDQILELFIEQDISRDELVMRGFDESDVTRVIKMVFQNEYKRRQAPPGIKITRRAFGKDRRYPITSGVINYLQED